ncbi:MAG: hypothetical protein ACI865_003307 [Flavobacteriaceae bacterium]|jgi:hypothetical protein
MKLLLLGFLSITATTFSQSISEELDAIPSNFIIMSNGVEFDVKKQFIIERAAARVSYSESENQSYGYGYAFRAPHLEFVTTTLIATRKKTKYDPRKSYKNYIIKFIDKDGEVLVSRYLNWKNIRKWTNEPPSKKIITYSICLSDMPMILIDETTTISIIQIYNGPFP